MEQKKGKTSFVHNIHIYQIASKTYDVVMKVSVCVYKIFIKIMKYILYCTL